MRRVWECMDCGWEWPLPVVPAAVAECDNCGGLLQERDFADLEDRP